MKKGYALAKQSSRERRVNLETEIVPVQPVEKWDMLLSR